LIVTSTRARIFLSNQKLRGEKQRDASRCIRKEKREKGEKEGRKEKGERERERARERKPGDQAMQKLRRRETLAIE